MRHIVTAMFGLVLACATGELAMRQIGWRSYVIDPRFGYTVEPGSVSRWRLEGNGTGHFGPAGERRAAPLPPDSPRILALGDSFTEALQVDDPEVYTGQVEATLREHGRSFAVVNVGMAHLSVADYIHHAPYYLDRFRPRWIVVQVRDDDFGSDAWKDLPGKARFRVEPDGGLIVSAPPMAAMGGLKRALFPLRRTSALFSYALERYNEIRTANAAEPPLFHAADALRTATPPADYPVERELEALMAAYAGRVTLLYLSDYQPAHPDERTPIEQRIVETCRRRGWSLAELRPAYARFSQRHEAPYGFSNSRFNLGHLNLAGHAAAAAALTTELERLAARALF